jgi:hypothetical protein
MNWKIPTEGERNRSTIKWWGFMISFPLWIIAIVALTILKLQVLPEARMCSATDKQIEQQGYNAGVNSSWSFLRGKKEFKLAADLLKSNLKKSDRDKEGD